METKKCQYCKEPITGKRDDAKFCSNTCKAKHWEEKKLTSKPSMLVQEEKNVANQLRGVLDGTPDKTNVPQLLTSPATLFQTVETKTTNLRWEFLYDKYKEVFNIRRNLSNQVQALQNQLDDINSRNGNAWVLGLAGTGAILGNETMKGKTEGVLIGAAAGLITGWMVKDATNKNREGEKKQLIENIQRQIKERVVIIQDTNKILKMAEEKLAELPQFFIIQKQVPYPVQQAIEAPKFSFLKAFAKSPEPLSGLQTDVSDVSLTAVDSNKIISSQHLKKMEFKALDFRGKWNILFGHPAIYFHCVVHGMSGEGKSTFAIQYAKYLADNFGRTIYISGEEGFSKTFKDKFSNNHAESKFLDVADLRTFDDIIREVPPNAYNFIFIDSLDNMKIDADKMKKIRGTYKNSALITISQSTKDGKMRGSYEIVHDCDMTVKVENGIATTTKNRFKEKGMTFHVFGKKNNDTIKSNFDPFML